MEQVSFGGDPKDRRDVEIAQTLGQNKTPAVIGVIAQCRARKENPSLRYVLNNYCDNSSVSSGSQSLAEDQRAYNAMFQRARLMAYLANEPALAVAEETLSRVFKAIGESRIAEKFQHQQRGIRPYVNRIIERTNWDVIAELRSYKPVPLSVEIEAPGVDPARVAELKELPKRCDQRLARAVSEVMIEKPFKEGSSTPYGRKRRERLGKWKRVEDLFPGMRFRPRKPQ